MVRKQLTKAIAGLVSIVLLETFGPVFAAQNAKCDRQCLINMMQQYLAALVKHDPKAVPFAGNVKFVENTANIPVGEGLWITSSDGPTEFQIYAADPVAQQVACLVRMKENINKDIILGARLKLQGGKIAEAEHLVIRSDLKNSLANLEKPRPALLEDLTPSDRTSRDQMMKIALSYYDALTGEDGTLAPFADNCERRENGRTTAGVRERLQSSPGDSSASADPAIKAITALPRTCAGQISAGVFAYITKIDNRRVFIADEQKGLAVGFSMFYHRSDLKRIKIKGVPGVDTIPAFQGTFNMPAMHIFKIRKGKIYEIEAIGFSLPYGIRSGW